MKWLFNSSMLLGAVLGWLIVSSAVNLRDTARHKGPGVVHYGDGEGSPEWSEVEPESKYKRHNNTMGVAMLILGLGCWFVFALVAKNQAAKSEAKEEYLEAQIRRAAAYQYAFTSALDAATRERATAQAELSGAFRDARANEELASRIYYAASKDAEGDPVESLLRKKIER